MNPKDLPVRVPAVTMGGYLPKLAMTIVLLTPPSFSPIVKGRFDDCGHHDLLMLAVFLAVFEGFAA